MTRRQLRVYFALHEMAERRRYAQEGREPRYTLDEVLHLVGGRGEGSRGARARSELSSDLKRLARLGLATLGDHHIEFAVSADQIRLGNENDGGGVGDLSGFWTMLEQIPNRRRTVPVPRRMVRALAAGFSRATTALILALLIRGLFWHRTAAGCGSRGARERGRPGQPSGTYRTDGRYKLSWVARVFGVSRRAVSDARSTLIELGWIEPLEVGQVMMNRFGLHDRIVPDWKHPDSGAVGGEEGTRSDTQLSAGSACPGGDFSAGSACPDLNKTLPLTGNQYTRNPAPRRAGPAGVSTSSASGKRGSGSRGREWRSGSGGGALRPQAAKRRRGLATGTPTIRDMRPGDLADTHRLLELHRQACGLGLSSPNEHGRLEFLALAERARTRGNRSGALFYWLLRERKTAFITLSDEDRAAQRLREHLNGPTQREADRERWGGEGPPRSNPQPFTEQERAVMACIRVAKKHRLDPAHVARKAKGWTRQAWDEAYEAFRRGQHERQGAMMVAEA
ncbi:MAG: hypothetical protein ACIAS6_01170 [Phycisphaerales bacterium JB060]